MSKPSRFISILPLMAAVYFLSNCSPDEPEVNSPGAGNNWSFTKVSGDNQITAIYDSLPDRLVVRLARLNGTGVDNENIRFKLTAGNGSVQKPVLSSDIQELIIPTNYAGEASAQFINYGGDSTTGFSIVRAEVVDSTQFAVVFTIGTN